MSTNCYESAQCAGTVLDGNYAGHLDSRLISAPLQLETVSGDQELHLRFWHWFSYSSYDSGTVQISVYDTEAGTWSIWESVSEANTSGIDLWSLMDINLRHKLQRFIPGCVPRSVIDDLEFIHIDHDDGQRPAVSFRSFDFRFQTILQFMAIV